MGFPPGFIGAGATEVHDALRLELDWYDSGVETSGQLGSVVKACMAVASGLATHVLCFRSVWEATAQKGGGRQGIGMGVPKATSIMQWSLPFAAASAAVWIAMYAKAHFHRYGTTREQLAWIALNGCRHAGLNPKAIHRDRMTIDDYFAARMIPEPFCLFDCDVPRDGATAFIVSRADRAGDLRRPPIRVEKEASALASRGSCRSTRMADSFRPAGCTATASCTRRACSSGARGAAGSGQSSGCGRGGWRRQHLRLHAAHALSRVLTA